VKKRAKVALFAKIPRGKTRKKGLDNFFLRGWLGGAVELMHDACDRLQSLENTAFMKKTTQRRKGAKTQRKRISRRDLGCLGKK
jgi:hypothetical protein